MSQQLSDRIAKLEEKLAAEEKQLQGRVRMTLITYVIVVLVVGIYTSMVIPGIKSRTSPEAITEMAKGILNKQIEDLRTTAIDQLRENSSQWAKMAVDHIVMEVPNLDVPIGLALDDVVNYVVSSIESGVMPAFTAALKENAGDLQEQYKGLQDDEKMQGVALIFLEVIETEMDKYINEKFITSVEDLQKKLRELSRPNAELTKRQDTHRRVIIYWSYLAEHDMGTSIFDDVIVKLKDHFKDWIDVFDLGEKKENDPEGVIKLEEL